MRDRSPVMQAIQGIDRRALDRARLSRDPRFDGKFFIAVTSTGIYCRPICPSPTSKSANVRYFATAAAAAEAGFRPCLRCRPEAAPGTPAWLGTSAVVRRALKLIHEGALDGSTVEQLATRVGVGARHLHRLFVRHVGASPIAVAQTRRLQFAKRLLDETHLSMTEIAMAAGFGSLRRFNDTFRSTYGNAPRELRRQRSARPGAREADGIVLRLSYRPPYDWAQVIGYLRARAIPGLERVDANGYARAVVVDDAHGSGRDLQATILVRQIADDDALELSVRGAVPAALFQVSTTARRVFDVAADPLVIARALRADHALAPLVRRRRGLRIPGAWDPFECAVRAIIGQGTSVHAARSIATRLVTELGVPLSRPESALTHLFPSAKAVAAADLRSMGLTAVRAEALKSLARAVAEGVIDFCAPVEDVTATVAAIPGVGDGIAQYVAMRALGDPDALPPDVSSDRVEAWQPWRSYAVMHLWCAGMEPSVDWHSREIHLTPRTSADRASASSTPAPDLS